MYIVTKVIQVMVGTCYYWYANMLCIVLLCDLKVTQMSVHCSLIWDLLLYKLKLNHNTVEANENNNCAKGEDAVDYSTVNRMVQEIPFRLPGP